MTKHALIRIKQRIGITGEQAVETARLAFSFGLGIKDFRIKKQKEYLKKLQRKSNGERIVKVYKDFVFIFGKDSKCITVLELPDYFVKKNVYMGKVLLRSPAKYMRNYYKAEYSYEQYTILGA